MVANAELEARILADRADRAAYLVYADWLAERGDPRGELVVVQSRLETARGDADQRAREAGLLAEHRRRWLGSLSGCGEDELECTWHRGFIAVRGRSAAGSSENAPSILPQLGTLALSPTEAGAQALLDHGDAYAHLTSVP